MKLTGEALLERVKRSAGLVGFQFRLQVNGFEGYFLRPVATKRGLQNSIDVTCLTNWRNRFVKSFLTEFVAREEGTEIWLAETVFTDNSKILFMIENEKEERIGYMGLAYIDWDKCYGEGDAIVRAQNAPKGLMSASLATLLNWANKRLGLGDIGLRVLSDNPALMFYKKLGFDEIKRIPLKANIMNDMVSWVEDDSLLSSRRYLVYHIWNSYDIKKY